MNIDTDAIRRLRDTLLRSEFDTSRRVKSNRVAQDAAILRRVEPFAETMYLVMMADEESALVERKALVAALGVLADGWLDASEMDAMLDRFEDSAKRLGSEARLEQIGARLSVDRDDREMAFTLGAVVALADDRVDVRENRVLDWVREYFGISPQRVAVLLDNID